jgi:hypothetical protein
MGDMKSPRNNHQIITQRVSARDERRMARQKYLSGADNAFLGPGCDGINGMFGALALFDFDKDYRFAAPGDQINLSGRGFKTTGQDLVTRQLQI